jgi:hypothetical protein
MARRKTGAVPSWWGFVLASLMAARPAFAADADLPVARELAKAGLQRYAAGDCSGAIPKLREALRLRESVPVAAALGECLAREGSLVEGVEHLRRAAKADVTKASAPVLAAQKRAQILAEEYAPKIARLRLELRPSTAVCFVDDVRLPGAMSGVAIPLDPGRHRVRIEAEGYRPDEREIELGQGAESSLSVELVQQVDLPKAQVGGTPVADDRPQSSSWPRIAGWSAVAVGAGALGVGAILGVDTLQRGSALRDACPDGRCPESERQALDDARGRGVAATWLLAAGAGVTAVGVYLLIAGGPSEQKVGLRPSSAGWEVAWSGRF